MPKSPVEETLGYVLVGVFFSLWLSGILSYQTFYFYTNYPNERKWLKAFVGALIVADGAQTIMGVATIWVILIDNLDEGEANAMKESTRLFQIYPVLVGLISSSVQIFFAWRVKVLSANLILFAVIVVLAIPQFAAGIAYTILTVKVAHFDEFWKYNGVIIGWVGFSVVCDIVITTTLTVTLRRHRTNPDLGAAGYLVHRVKMMSIQNGLVTIIWSLALLVALAAAKHGAHYMFFYPLGKVYLVTMLASLNSRSVRRQELDPRIHSVLERNSCPRLNTPSLYSWRGSTDNEELLVRPIPRVSSHRRSASRTMEYLPVTQEEDEDVPRGQREGGRPSTGSFDEGKPLVGESSPNQPTGSPPHNGCSSFSNRPRGPRLPPGCAARSTSG